jgi:threonine dehydrogenase-like Zn-dependent dehydrogenase
LVMGHEFAGVTPDGRHVTVNPIVSCGRCDLCRRGLRHVCRQRAIIGVHRQGAFAEHVAVPRSAIHPLPAGMDFATGTMVEPVANAVHAWHIAGAEVGARVGIIGAGPIGLACLLVAGHAGAGSIAVADLAPDRRALARRLGASEVAADLDGEHGEHGELAEFDVTFDAVGTPVTRRTAVERLRPGGTAVFIGLHGPEAGLDANDLVRAEKRVLGSFAYRDDEFATALRLASVFDLGWLQTFPLAHGPVLFAQLLAGRTDVVKAVLQP